MPSHKNFNESEKKIDKITSDKVEMRLLKLNQR